MRRGNLFWGFVILVMGVLFLLSNLGVFQGIDPWNFAWPLILIMLGVWILSGNLFGGRFKGESQPVSIPLESATSARVNIGHGAGRLTIDSQSAPGVLISGSVVGGFTSKVNRSGGEVQVKLRPQENSFPFINWGWSNGLEWNLSLARDIPISLEIGTGANESVLDLTDLQITALQVHTGASGTRVSLPANAGFTQVTCEGGVADLRLQVPSGVAARIRYHGALSSLDVNTARFPHADSEYRSQDYDVATNKIDIDVQMGVGSVHIQ